MLRAPASGLSRVLAAPEFTVLCGIVLNTPQGTVPVLHPVILAHTQRLIAGKSGPKPHMRIALFQPDIPQNTGTIIRMASCFGIPIDLIRPAGFSISDKALRRAGLDYIDAISLVRHDSWDAFCAARLEDQTDRLIALTTQGDLAHVDHTFHCGDILLLGRESAGLPDYVHEAAHRRIFIPMQPGMRSLNVAVACAIATGEALRQLGQFAGGDAIPGQADRN